MDISAKQPNHWRNWNPNCIPYNTFLSTEFNCHFQTYFEVRWCLVAKTSIFKTLLYGGPLKCLANFVLSPQNRNPLAHKADFLITFAIRITTNNKHTYNIKDLSTSMQTFIHKHCFPSSKRQQPYLRIRKSQRKRLHGYSAENNPQFVYQYSW